MTSQKPSDIFLEEIEAESVFKDEKKLSIDFIPEEIPHRTAEFRKLVRFFKSIVGKDFGTTRQFVMITGPIGVGKTLLSKKFGSEMENYAQRFENNLIYRHINCRKHRTPFLILNMILKSLNPFFPSRGFSSEELLGFLKNTLERDKAHLLLCLDEIDYITQGTDNILYSLTRLNDEVADSTDAMISLVIISKKKHFLYSLDNSTKSSLAKNSIELGSYSSDQLRDILELRAQKAFHSQVVDENILSHIADIGAENGDARYVLELLWRSGKIADQKRAEKIVPEHVRIASASIYPFPKEIIVDLPLHQKIVLLAITELIEPLDSSSYVTLNEVKDDYKKLCLEFEVRARKRVQIWNYIQELRNLGIISTKVTQRNDIKRVTLIGLPSIPAEELNSNIRRQIDAEIMTEE